jgi:7-keto-8-aminopelargonate synthetase-like enzyme
MFQTSLPPAVAAGLIVALDIVRDEPERRQTLLRRAAHLREELVRLGFNILNSETQIIPICFGDEGRAKRATDMLWTNGIFAPCYYYPAVGPAEAMVRVNITSGHSAEHLERLLTIVASAGRELGVIR